MTSGASAHRDGVAILGGGDGVAACGERDGVATLGDGDGIAACGERDGVSRFGSMEGNEAMLCYALLCYVRYCSLWRSDIPFNLLLTPAYHHVETPSEASEASRVRHYNLRIQRFVLYVPFNEGACRYNSLQRFALASFRSFL